MLARCRPFEAITECSTLLAKPECVPRLRRPDIDFLRKTCERLMAALRKKPFAAVPVHGDPHLGNVLISKDGPLWTDFEAVCSGPLEWDLTCHPISYSRQWQIDLELFDVLRQLRSFCVVVWCSVGTDRPLEKQEAATLHLERLRARP